MITNEQYQIALAEIGRLTLELTEIRDKYVSVSADCNTLRQQYETLLKECETQNDNVRNIKRRNDG